MYSSSICSSVPSILRNSRYRRDQRQLEEEEEMWFNEDDDFDDGEAVVPAANDILSKKLDSDIESIGKMIDKKQDGNSPKLINNSNKSGNILNNNLSNNATGGSPPSPTSGDALVDYEGDSDEEEEEESGDVLSPSPKRARLT
ncbi:hypothetical protein C0J52_21946 [Blattella germanica]|nr:hypothetical protein C0J52_21946 [Blattella germanica]